LIKLLLIIIKEYLKYTLGIINYDDAIINTLEKLSNYNILFTKIFQWSCNKNFLTEKISIYLNKYAHNVPYNNEDIDHKNLLKLMLYMNKSNNKLEIFDIDKPTNSGSISLIFNAKLNDKPVIIKILRKNIKNTINKGLDLLIFIGNISKYIPKLNLLMIDKLINKNKSNLYNQIHFINEVHNLQIYHEKFLTHKYIVTPVVYSEYTEMNNSLIIMDYIDGKCLHELTFEELNHYYYSFSKFILKSMFSKNILHGDLHPGNILFFNEIVNNEKIYKIGIIDMGMVFDLNVEQVNFIYLLFLGMFNDEFMKFINYIEEDNNKLLLFENIDQLQIDNCLNEIKKSYSEGKIFKSFKHIQQVIDDIYSFLKIINDNNCEFETNINKLILGVIPIFNVINKLGPGVDKNLYIKEEVRKLNIDKLMD
jgi:predicted unusual protein kinase regulating ubiquinone biosynthesis (AarF/ABC1/UbiB family)